MKIIDKNSRKMRYYIDTEFIETPGHIELISIGIVCQDGREYYAVNTEADISKASTWVIQNVLEKMPEYSNGYNDLRGYAYGAHQGPNKPQEKKDLAMIKEELLQRCGQHNNVPEQCEFWGYYADYDWVVFCWIFGTMMDLPSGFPMYCKDLKQLMDSYTGLDKEWKRLNCPDPEGEHNALVDAKWNQKLHKVIAEAILKYNSNVIIALPI